MKITPNASSIECRSGRWLRAGSVGAFTRRINGAATGVVVDIPETPTADSVHSRAPRSGGPDDNDTEDCMKNSITCQILERSNVARRQNTSCVVQGLLRV